MIELACSTHALAVDGAMFAGPVVFVGIAAWITVRRDRRRDEENDGHDERSRSRGRERGGVLVSPVPELRNVPRYPL
jgi:hypothetical protein